MAVWDQSHRGSYHIYGHVHRNITETENGVVNTHSILNHEEMKNAFNVGCMLPYVNYTPLTLDDLIALNKQ